MTLNRVIIASIISFFLLGCKISSSFQPGTTSNMTASTILIPMAENQAAQGPTNLGITLTEKIRDYYQTSSKLTVNSNKESDLELYITVSDYFSRQVLNTAEVGGTATQMELIVTVRYKYIDNENPSNTIENKTKSQKLTYNASLTLEQAETQILPDILDLLVQEIFNETLARW